jgi:hypothetical protein
MVHFVVLWHCDHGIIRAVGLEGGLDDRGQMDVFSFLVLGVVVVVVVILEVLVAWEAES